MHVLSYISHVQLFVTLLTVGHQAPLPMGFSRQEYWSGLPCPPPGDCPNPGTEPLSPVAPTLWVDSLLLNSLGSPSFSLVIYFIHSSVYNGKVYSLLRRAWQPTPVSSPGESHGQRSLAGYSPWGHKESDTTE